ncbi:TIGR04282 family arsenosugar biosynthesis glycosyltransferase [Synechococcus sp. ATX 2A4]|uniref:TIGR04282 family arsenosugar biosynthesis glycosyltransferase n=1 Tax=Synechococcus sp. ATX 2A4 TaxID=2823727 RepID=UPI0020CE1A95|nr:TIGR04282 family arsenosugar biosynthesis glycosyltransferase [Synechococcus sp. ATX 2A4]
MLAKAPVPGQVKTRLEPALGPAGAAQLAERLLRRTIRTACASGLGVVELCTAPAPDHPAWRRLNLPPGLAWSAQADGDLGARLAAVAERAQATGTHLVLLGMDCPGLDVHHLQVAAAQLAHHEAALIPSLDGGYVLLALSRFAPSLFSAIPWSTDAVCGITRERLRTLGWSWGEQSPLADIDEPADLARLPLGLRAHLGTCHGHRFTPTATATRAHQGPARQPAGGDPGAQ